MNTPTKEQRDKIDKAIDKIASLCANGCDSPSQAIAKVASAMKLTPDYLPIIVRAFNTGIATIHREDSHTLEQKVASYPIAYLDEVMSILKESSPMNKKAQQERPRDDFWGYPADVHFPDAWSHLKEDEPEEEQIKQASVKPIIKEKAQDRVLNTVNLTADEATRVKYAAQQERDEAYQKVVSVMRKYGGIKPDVARQYAQTAYGNEGLKIVEKIIADNYLDKKAQYQRESYIPHQHPFAQAFESLINKNEALKKASADEKQVLESCVEIVNQYVRPKDRYVPGSDSIDAMFKEAELAQKKKTTKRHFQSWNCQTCLYP